jgi:DNA-binding transcriptional regulator YdaS (Cro superfamily)
MSTPGALTIAQLRARMVALGYEVKSDAQIRQWRYRYKDRIPSPENCMGLERASDGLIRRQDLRPDDYWLTWPELAKPIAHVSVELLAEAK